MTVAGGAKYRIVILGDGAAGCMAAAYLAQSLPRDTHEILLLPVVDGSDSLGAFGAIEASTPSTRRFLSELELGDEDVARQVQAAFSLGVAFSGWSSRAPTYFLPFGDQGAPLGGVAFHQLAARLRAAGREVRLGDYSAAALMAQAGRFAPPSDDPASPLSTYGFGLQLNRSHYADLLRAVAVGKGVLAPAASVERVEGAAGGLLGAALLGDGQRIAGDLFIDASGPAAIGLTALGQSNFQSWAERLPCDRSVELLLPDPVPPSPYSLITAVPTGWRRTVPSNGQRGEALIYSSALSNRQSAEDLLLESVGAVPVDATIHHSRFTAGRRANSWVGNCIAIGGAACLLEPLASQSLVLVENALRRLVRLFPSSEGAAVEAREYNRETGLELDRARDFVVARYALNGRVGEPLWDAARNASRSPELDAKLALYASRGRVSLVDGDLFDEDEWTALLDAQGLRADRYDIRADGFSLERLDRFLSNIRKAILSAVAPLPRHGDFLSAMARRTAA